MKTNAFATTMMLMATLLAGLAAVPGASAHICTDSSGTTSCGDCNGSLTSPYHQHSTGYGVYCTSIGPAVIGGSGEMTVSEAVESAAEAFGSLF